MAKETRPRCNPIIYLPLLLFVVLLYFLDVIQMSYYIKLKPTNRVQRDVGFLVKTVGCQIPLLNPFDEMIMKYIYRVRPFVCSAIPPLVSSNLTSIQIEEYALPFYNVSNFDHLDCCYEPFWRTEPNQDSPDNSYGLGECKSFTSSANIQEEFIKVVCRLNDTEIYKDYHSFVPIKRNRTTKSKLNLLVIGMDSISLLNFHRQMPLTKSFIDNLKAIEMKGYNKVGDNTFPNLIPILTGLSEDELISSCWKTSSVKFDNCTFIWNNYSDAGYLTSYAEDSSWMGVFNYVKHGFQKQPTDYYWKTFNYLAEKDIGHTKPYNADLCLGPRPVYAVMLDYILKFVKSLRDHRYFSFFWMTSLSHDNLNYPALGDKTYRLFFENLNSSSILNNTVMVILSDHGIRWGEIRSTHQGHLEERLPFLYFRFPAWFSDIYPSAITNLRRNSRRLTTPFDLHETFNDILNIDKILPKNIKVRSMNINGRGISLFLPVPENRTCTNAGIAPHWCTCQKSVDVKVTDSIVVNGAEFIVDHMNKQLKGYKGCAKLELDEIRNARLLKSDDYLKNNSTIHDYTIILKTSPGYGVFEATVRCVFCNDTKPFTLAGTISRINLYGNTSSCISEFHLKLYCYCGS